MPNNRARPPLGSLLGHNAKPRRELTPILEGASVTDRGDQRCRRHRADPFDLAETLADLAVAIDLSVVTPNPRIQFGQLFPQLCHQRANQGIENAVLIVANDPCESLSEIADVLCNDDAVLTEKTADLIDEPDAISDQATANPMNRLHRQLFGGLDRHEAHVWSTDRFADGTSPHSEAVLP